MESLKISKKICLVCPVLNCWNYTKQFIDNLDFSQFNKLIIINNGSNSENTLNLWQLSKNKQIDVIHHPNNIGVAPAWNEGTKRAIETYKSEYIIICNNDIIVRPDTIKNLIKGIKKPGIALITPTNTKDFDEEPKKLYEFLIPKKLKLTDNPDFSCFMITKKTIEKVGYFDENFWPAYFEDNDYHYRIKLAGLRGVKSNKSLYFHFGSMTIKSGGAIAVISNENYLKNQAYFVKKWGGLPGQKTSSIPLI